MSGRARGAAIVSLLVVVTAAALARGQQAAGQSPLFRAATALVEVDVVVHDERGRFVADLRPEDFDLREEGRPRPIEVFSVVGQPPAASNPPSAAPAAAAAAAPRSTSRLFVAVLDTEHLTTGGFRRAQAAALGLFSGQFRPGDLGGVVVDGQMVNRRLTSDRDELVAAVRAAKPASPVSSRLFDQRQWPRVTDAEAIRLVSNNDRALLDELVSRACTDDPTLCNHADLAVRGKAQQLVADARATADRTLRSVLTLVSGLARIDGRKSIVIFSEGFVAEESWPLVRQVVDAAARANARLYTLDARGLERGSPRQDDRPGGDDSLARLLAQFDIGADPANSLAVDTGGFAVRNANVFDQAIARVADDASAYYVLGFRPEAPADERLHRVSVAVRRPGIVARARRGYVAVQRSPPPAPAAASSAEAAHAPAAPFPAPPAAPVPPVLPATSGAPSAAGAVASIVAGGGASATAAAGVRLRPQAAAHVDALEPGRSAADPDAQRGWEAYERGDVEGARAALSIAAKRAAARPWIHYALGLSEYALRRYRDAAAQWEEVRSSAPEFEPVYFDLADAYLQTAEADKAVRVLRAARTRWPADAEAANALGVAQVARGALDDAVRSFEGAIAAAPSDGVGYFNLAKTLEMRYVRSRRFVQQTGTWVANESDRATALANYERYLSIGGALENAAREGISRLSWSGK